MASTLLDVADDSCTAQPVYADNTVDMTTVVSPTIDFTDVTFGGFTASGKVISDANIALNYFGSTGKEEISVEH